MSAFTEFFKVSPDSAKYFPFFEKKNEEFYYLLSKHSMKALGIVSKLINEVNIAIVTFGFLFVVVENNPCVSLTTHF